MKHCGTKQINTERLLLRPFTPADAPAMFANWASDPEVTRFLSWPAHESEEISALVIADWERRYSENSYYQWAIVLRELDMPIGSIAAVNLDEGAGRVEIGYCIGKRWWHQGITSEALCAVMDFFFREVGVNRVEACHDTNNPNSGAVMAKCGMRYEGTQRQARNNNSGLCDISWYAILAEDIGLVSDRPL